jgi:hypothetical protein
MFDCMNGVCKSGETYTYVNSGVGDTFFRWEHSQEVKLV